MTDTLEIERDTTPAAEDSAYPVETPRQNINISGHTVTQATAHLEEHQRGLIRWLHQHARDAGWDWDDLVRAAGYSSTTWYRIWSDKYVYPSGGDKAGERMPIDKQCQAIARLKKTVEARAAVHQTGFIETSVWKRVDWLCRRAFIRQKIGVIYGESQIGKTTCLEEHARRNNSGQTTLVEIPVGGMQHMCRRIAKALHVPYQTNVERMQEDITGALDGSKLLILDEVHRIFTTYHSKSVMKCLDTIRSIHDQSKCGLVLCGTNVLKNQMLDGAFAQYLKQLRRRRIYELQLPSVPPREDLDAMAAKFGLRPATGEAEEIIQHIAKEDGFGRYIIQLTDAAEIAAHKKEKLTWPHFIKVHDIAQRMASEVK